MPEVHVAVRWPDGAEQRFYSPSLVVEEHLAADATYPVAEFLTRSTAALTEGSARVEKIYGYPCSRAAASIASLTAKAAALDPDSQVRVLSFER